MVLIFGCRSELDDYYYKDEWESLQEAGADLTVITAFSRTNPSEGKIYVQHKIRQAGELLSNLIVEQQANIYVSGRAKFMPKSVEKAFIEIVGTAMGVENQQEDPSARQYID